MTGRNHMKIAFSVSILTLNPIIMGYAVIGSVIPDIDHYNSIASNFLFAPYISKVSKHRGFTHSLIGVITVTIVTFLSINNLNVVFGISIGYISHILSDMLTCKGVQLFWPYTKRYKFWLTFTTGDDIESVISNMSVILGLYYFISNLEI